MCLDGDATFYANDKMERYNEKFGTSHSSNDLTKPSGVNLFNHFWRKLPIFQEREQKFDLLRSTDNIRLRNLLTT